MLKANKWYFLIVSLFVWPQFVWAADKEVDYFYVGPTHGQTWAGVQQGLKEARLQGQFMGLDYQIKPIKLADVDGISVDKATAIIMATDAKSVLRVAKKAKFSNVPVFNLRAEDDSLRKACLSNLLNILPSKKMKQDAVAQWLVKHPNDKVTGQAWHYKLVKFAGIQLNKRFTQNQGTKMDDDAWAGWISVKMLSDTVARTQDTKAKDMLSYLKTKLSFDDQKGDTSTFRENGQLRQSVLLIKNDSIVAEAPLRGVKGGLDSLGIKSCK